jgi:ABC-type polysaccharide transport system permease subunit
MINEGIPIHGIPAMRRKKRVVRSRLILTLYALPFIVLIIMFSYVPLAGWSYAFFQVRLGQPLMNSKFVGWFNFQYIFRDFRNITQVLKNTFVFYGLQLLNSVVPVALAIMISELPGRRYKKLVQTTTTLPNFISWVIVYSFAFSLFSSQGLVNSILVSLGVMEKPYLILQDGGAVYWFQNVLNIWKNAGWSSIIYLAAITGIDGELYDAASVDGAGRVNKIFHITLPGIAPTYAVLLLLSAGNMLSVGFDQFLLFDNPFTRTNVQVLDLYIYFVGLQSTVPDIAYATAIGMIKTVVSVIMLFAVNFISKKVRGSSLI